MFGVRIDKSAKYLQVKKLAVNPLNVWNFCSRSILPKNLVEYSRTAVGKISQEATPA